MLPGLETFKRGGWSCGRGSDKADSRQTREQEEAVQDLSQYSHTICS